MNQAFVWAGSRWTENALLVHLCLAYHADDDGYVQVAQSQLAEETKVSRKTVNRIVADMTTVGDLIVRQKGSGRTPAVYQLAVTLGVTPNLQCGVQPPTTVAVTPGVTPNGFAVTPGVTGNPLLLELGLDLDLEVQEPSVTGNPNRAAARALVNEVYERRNPKPMTPWFAAVKIAERFLDAGWSVQQVTATFLTVRTISLGWVEAELNKSRSSDPNRGVMQHEPQEETRTTIRRIRSS